MNNPFPLQYSRNTQQLPPQILLGGSSWTHEFWKGQIYHREYKSAKDFNLNSLAEYASLGLFRLVEIDSTFYAPPKEETLVKYAELTPENFLFTAKIWERLSIPAYPDIKRYGKLAGQENESFLNPKVFTEEFLPPFRNPLFAKKLGVFLLQFPKMRSAFATSKLFLERLENFLGLFPKDLRLAIEIRNPEILKPAYVALLNKFKAAHCFSQWDSMQPLLDQMKIIAAAGGLSADFYFARLITPLGMSFEEAGSFFEPFYEIKRRDEPARQAVVRIARRAIEKNIPAFVIVNNRFEGNTPQTAVELEKMLLSSAL